LVLASASPRRVELLAAIGVAPEVRPAHLDETRRLDEAGTALVARLSEAKARAVARPGELVIGADTVVLVGDDVLGKPAPGSEAGVMLRRLAGRRHEVVTGISVVRDGRATSAVCRTTVQFRTIDAEDVAWYVATGEGADKAGGYGIQGAASVFVERIEGSYPNVVGLPVATVDELCRQHGWPLRTWAVPRR
jgi:septum formation protein